jgi:hypothetical protein
MFENYAPPIEIKGDGSHWYATWLMLRDSLSFWPWYRNTMKDRPRRVDLRSSFDADHLHNWTFEVMKQHASYHHVIKAALRHDARAALQKLGGRILLCKDHSHPFAKYDETLIASRTDMPSCEVMADPAAHARQIARFLS